MSAASLPYRFPLAIVVDDDIDIGLAARLALRAQFDEVVALDSPDRLLPLVAERRPDVVLLDLNFVRGATDGREGFEWLARLVAAEFDAYRAGSTARHSLAV